MGLQYGPLFTPILFFICVGQQPRTQSELKRFICATGADGSDHRGSITISPHLILQRSSQRHDKDNVHMVFTHGFVYLFFCHSDNLEFLFIQKYGESNNLWQVVSHEIAVSLPPLYPFNLQQFNQAAFVGTWALLCALSLLQSHQDFLFAYLRMRCGGEKYEARGRISGFSD